MSLPRYEKYKDSGIEWLGEVPEHWDIIAIKWISSVSRGASPRPIDDPKYFDEAGEFAWVRIADVSASCGFLLETPQRLSELGSSLSVKIQPDDLFISIAGTVGKPCISKIKACIHDGFVYFPKLKLNPFLLYRIFEAGVCYGGLGKLGTQLNLNTDTIGSIRIGVPPFNEIENLLLFLDIETTKIDDLIEESSNLIALLKEKRQALISHAVTKGLNPDVTMKNSGVEWLGEVPEHWDVFSLKYVVSMKSGEQITSDSIEDSGDYPVFGGNGLRGYTSKFTHNGFFPLIGRQGALCGNINYASGKFWASEHAVVVFPKVEYSVIWLGELMRSMNLGQYSVTAAQPGLSVESIGNLRIPFPYLHEQETIAQFLDEETTKIDDLIAESQNVIELLKERRSALISSAVTGKIDVRNYHA
jgi:type I restriction enzyme S subunit